MAGKLTLHFTYALPGVADEYKPGAKHVIIIINGTKKTEGKCLQCS